MSYDAVRKDYVKQTLEEADCLADPISMLDAWLKEALKESLDANAMTISTLDDRGYPDSRIVLIRNLDARGLIFYTNYESDKGRNLANHSKISVNFFWPWLERQVRIQGDVEKIGEAESDTYFASRPRESQLGAWASKQSAEMDERNSLQVRMKEYTERFEGQEVPRPPFWGGYLIKPISFEFWQGRASRLHDRIKYEPSTEGWSFKRLYP